MSRRAIVTAIVLVATSAAAALALPGAALPDPAKLHPAIAARDAGEIGWGVAVFDAAPDAAALAKLGASFTVVHPWRIIPAVGLVGPKEAFLALSADARVQQIDAATGEFLLRQSVPQIGAPSVWNGLGFDGTGVTVAVLDTGIDDKHPDLDGGKVVRRVSFETYWMGVPGTADVPGQALVDGFGHGTHVASTVAGSGDVPSPVYGDRYRGVAPGASLVSVQISTSGGVNAKVNGQIYSTWAALDAIQWVTENRDALDIRVASNSWGSSMTFNGWTSCIQNPAAQAILASLATEPTLVWVFAAGNEGPGASTIRSPGCLPEVITVGAVDKAGGIAGFSSRGPTRGDGHPKPDVVAPGVTIVAAQTINPSVYHAFNALNPLVGGPRDPAQQPFYTWSDGTSMATPHVAGLAALMIDAAPCLTHAQVKTALQSTADDLGTPGYDLAYGHGLVDSVAAVASVDALC